MFWTSTHPNCLSPQQKINSSCSRWRCPSLISVEYYPHLHRFSPLHMSQMCFCNPRARIERCSSCFANVWCHLHHDLRYGARGGDQIDSTWTSMNVGAANWIRLDIVRPQKITSPTQRAKRQLKPESSVRSPVSIAWLYGYSTCDTLTPSGGCGCP